MPPELSQKLEKNDWKKRPILYLDFTHHVTGDFFFIASTQISLDLPNRDLHIVQVGSEETVGWARTPAPSSVSLVVLYEREREIKLVEGRRDLRLRVCAETTSVWVFPPF